MSNWSHMRCGRASNLRCTHWGVVAHWGALIDELIVTVAYACPVCNCAKLNYVDGKDPATGEVVPIYSADSTMARSLSLVVGLTI